MNAERSDARPYGFGSYLRDRIGTIACGTTSLIVVAFMLCVLQLGVQAIAIVIIMAAIPLVIALVVGYARRRRFFSQLARAAEDPASSKHLASGIDRPRFAEGAIAWDALAAQEAAFSEEVGAQSAEMQAYRDYIELWIHEVKAPIAASRLMLDPMHDQAGERLSAEMDRIERMVESALYYARSTSLSGDYSIREVPLAKSIRAVCKKHARFLIGRGVAPDVQVPEDLHVLADRQWVEFIIAQIVLNAANYGATRVRFTVQETEGEAGAATVLQIADNGCGIPAADMPRIFERGFTGQNGKARGISTGMGLYLVSMMCQKMGLGIVAASEQGEGTRMRISFPHDRQRIAFHG